jgi:two-component system, NtrC family, response regulator AtoC
LEKILIVDDELNMQLVLKAMLQKEGYEILTASDGLEALKILKASPVAVVVTDLKMPRLDGMGLLEKIQNIYPAIPVIMITAHGTVATAVEAIKKGALDYIMKPFEQDDLKNIIHKAVLTRRLNEGEAFPGSDIDRSGIIGSGEVIERLLDSIRKVAATTTTVLITGETGTGKELVANAIHRNSPRRENPFIKINCAAISENLLESELFGYEKGAFTGAQSTKPGRFELADRGTLFLDEVGELPLEMQVKLLRVIQDYEFERVGGLKTIKVDVRLLAATNRNLLQEVKNGRFREDLFYRLNVFPVHLYPLRERREDIPALADYILARFNRKLEKNIRSIDEGVMSLFIKYDWPGNIRELENILERLALVSSGDTIRLEDLPPDFAAGQGADPGALNAAGLADADRPFKEVIRDRMEDVERQMIESTLEECEGNVTKAAKKLGMSRKGLQLKMIKYDLRK